MGDASVGKTSLVRHYCEGFFRDNYLSTIGVSFLRKEVQVNYKGEQSDIVLQLWDLGGQTIFSNVRQSYLRGTNGALILFDLTQLTTLTHVNNWFEDVYRSVGKIPTLIIGNKADLEYHPSIIEKAETLCKKLGIELCLTSAKTGKNLLEIFEKLSLMLIEIS